jgi:hypothetical protein
MAAKHEYGCMLWCSLIRQSSSADAGMCVLQASFEPLGLTVAVAKDRAIESLMQVGDTFVLNCLGEGQYGPLMKVCQPPSLLFPASLLT